MSTGDRILEIFISSLRLMAEKGFQRGFDTCLQCSQLKTEDAVNYVVDEKKRFQEEVEQLINEKITEKKE